MSARPHQHRHSSRRHSSHRHSSHRHSAHRPPSYYPPTHYPTTHYPPSHYPASHYPAFHYPASHNPASHKPPTPYAPTQRPHSYRPPPASPYAPSAPPLRPHSHRPQAPRPQSHRVQTHYPSTYPTTTTSTRPRGYPKPLGRGRGFPVLSDGRFLTSHPTTLLLHPSPTSWTVRTRRGERLFTLTRRYALLSRERHLLDARTNRPVLRARSARLSARSTARVYAAGECVLTVQRKSVIEGRTVYGLVRGRGSPDLVVSADAKGKRFTFTDRRSLEIATVKKSSVRGRGGERKTEFRMHLNPGYDAALFVTAMVCVQEALNE